MSETPDAVLIHMLGLRPGKPSYRNHFVSAPGHHSQPALDDLEAGGFVERMTRPGFLADSDLVYRATERGIVRAQAAMAAMEPRRRIPGPPPRARTAAEGEAVTDLYAVVEDVREWGRRVARTAKGRLMVYARRSDACAAAKLRLQCAGSLAWRRHVVSMRVLRYVPDLPGQAWDDAEDTEIRVSARTP